MAELYTSEDEGRRADDENAKALREMCETAPESLSLHQIETMQEALLDRLSGEAVTTDVITNAREFLAEDEFPDEDGAMREQYIESIRHLNALMALLPAGMDTGWRNIDECPTDIDVLFWHPGSKWQPVGPVIGHLMNTAIGRVPVLGCTVFSVGDVSLWQFLPKSPT